MGIFDFFNPNVKKMESKKDVEGLIKALKHKNEDIRIKAASSLGEIKDKRALDSLIQVVEDEDDTTTVRITAAFALGRIGDVKAVKPILQASSDEYRRFRSHLYFRMMDEFKGTNTYKMYKKSCQDLEDENLFILLGAPSWAIKNIESGAFLSSTIREDAKKILLAAPISLEQIGEPAVELLIQALKSDDLVVQVGALQSLRNIRDERAVNPIILALKSKNYIVRFHAALALGFIRDKRAIEPLIQASEDKESCVREVVNRALAEIQKDKEK